MDNNGFNDPTDDQMYQWMLQKLGAPNGGQQQQGSQGGGATSLLKIFGKGNGQQQGQFGGTDPGTGDNYTDFSGGDFGGGFVV